MDCINQNENLIERSYFCLCFVSVFFSHFFLFVCFWTFIFFGILIWRLFEFFVCLTFFFVFLCFFFYFAKHSFPLFLQFAFLCSIFNFFSNFAKMWFTITATFVFATHNIHCLYCSGLVSIVRLIICCIALFYFARI